MARLRTTLGLSRSGSGAAWTGRIDIGTSFSSDETRQYLTGLELPGSDLLPLLEQITVNVEGATFSEEFRTAGTITLTNSGGDSVTITGIADPDRMPPYVWIADNSDDVIAFIQALGLTSQQQSVTFEMSDGVDDGLLELTTLVSLQGNAWEEFEYQFPGASGGLAPYTYRLTHALEGMMFDANTRTLSGTLSAANTGANTLTYRVTDAEGTYIERVATLAIAPDDRPLWRIEVDWDGDGRFTNDHSEVTARVLTVANAKRGRDFHIGFFGTAIAGVLDVELQDNDRLYDRFNEESALHNLAVPGRRVRASILHDGEYSVEWNGFISEIQPEEIAGRRNSWLTALGPLSLLPRRRINVQVQEAITRAVAARNILNTAGIAAEYIGELEGAERMDYWFVDEDTSITALQDIEESGLGVLGESKAGQIFLSAARDVPENPSPIIAFVAPGATPNPGERAPTGLRWSDPLKGIANRIVVPVDTYEAGDGSETVWELLNPVLIPAGDTITLRVRAQSIDQEAGVPAAVLTWDPLTDYLAHDTEDDSGADRTANVSITLQPGALTARLTISNSDTAGVYLTRCVITGTVLRYAAQYDQEQQDDASIGLYNELPYEVATRWIGADRADGFARTALTALKDPQARGTLTYVVERGDTLPDISDLVSVRFLNSGTRLYHVETVEPHWRRNGELRYTLIITEVDDKPAAEAPTPSVNAVENGFGGVAVRLSAHLTGGFYDGDVRYQWFVVPVGGGGQPTGSLDDDTLASPTWTRPTVTQETEYRITVQVRVDGTGRNAKRGTDSFKRASTLTSVVLLPDASAPNVAIDPVADDLSETEAVLSATLDGGAYDGDATYAWTVSEGTLDDATLPMPTWTRPAVTEETDVTIGLTVTVGGSGVNARADTSDMETATLTATVTIPIPDAVAPTTLRIMRPADGDEGTAVDLEIAELSGGLYDSLEYRWSISPASAFGQLSNGNTATPEWRRPQVSADTTANIQLTVTARGEGTNARDMTAASVTAFQTALIRDTGGPGPSVTTDTDYVYIRATSAPPTPTGGESTQAHTPSGWSRSALTATATQDVYRSARTRTFTGGAFTSATAWETPTLHTARTGGADETFPSWGSWTEIAGTRDTTWGGWSATSNYRGSGADRERQYERTGTTTWQEERTRTGSQGTVQRETRNQSQPASQTEWRDAPADETFPSWGSWTEIAGTRDTTWGGWSATSTYRRSCDDRQRQYERTGTTTWQEERTRTGSQGTVQRETRNQSRSASDTEWRDAPESGTWGQWEDVGSPTTTTGPWSATGSTRSSCDTYEIEEERTITVVQDRRRTHT